MGFGDKTALKIGEKLGGLVDRLDFLEFHEIILLVFLFVAIMVNINIYLYGIGI